MGFDQINFIRRYGILRDVEGHRDAVPRFRTRNLIYGWNYSGKTTFSRIFRTLSESESHPDFADGEFSFSMHDGTEWRHNDLDAHNLPIRVFNSDYVAENIAWEGVLDPILIIGEENIDLQRRAKVIRHLIDRRRTYARRLHRLDEDQRRRVDDAASEVARQVRQQFGHTPFNRDPHLRPFIDTVRTIPDSYILTDEQYRTAQSQLTAEQRTSVDRLPSPPDLSGIWTTAEELLAQTAQQETIARLKENPEIEGWVETGLKIHEGKTSCEFCGNTIPTSRIAQLAGHFSQELQNLKRRSDERKDEYRAQLLNYQPVDSSRLYQDLQLDYERNVARLNTEQASINTAIYSLIDELEDKKSHAEVSYVPATTWPEGSLRNLDDAVSRINDLLETHNTRTARFEEERQSALSTLIHHKAAEFVRDTDYERTIEHLNNINDRITSNSAAISRIQEREATLNAAISDARRGADEINRYFQLYFGKDDISVSMRSDDKYELLRGGYRAKNLSEGEKTAIAFSYFLTTVMDGTAQLDQTVVVIDDPVSSLDSNHIYNTYSMIKTLLKDVHQLFLLTHNFELFRIAKTDSFFKEFVRSGDRRASWYLVKRISRHESTIVDLPDALRRYNSEYHYIFCLLYRFMDNPDNYDEIYFNIPNLLRKLLETYTSFRMPSDRSTLNERLDRMFKENVTSARVYRFINHLSHADTMDANVEFPAKEECVEVVGETMQMLARFDERHYESMAALVSQ